MRNTAYRSGQHVLRQAPRLLPPSRGRMRGQERDQQRKQQKQQKQLALTILVVPIIVSMRRHLYSHRRPTLNRPAYKNGQRGESNCCRRTSPHESTLSDEPPDTKQLDHQR